MQKSAFNSVPMPHLANLKTYVNLVVNSFDNYSEIIYYKKEFLIPHGCVSNDINRARKFFYDGEILKPINDSVKIQDLQKTLFNSSKRAKDNLYGYALSNTWDYFITLTFSPRKIQRDNDLAIINAWCLFRKRLQYHIPNIKILLVPEYHDDGKCLHFHGFFGNCNLKPFLRKSKVKTNFGDIVYNLKSSIYDLGFTTVVEINNKDANSELKISNYLCKYFTKGVLKYNRKSYYHTNNLDFKDKRYFLIDESEFENFKTISGAFIKETDKFISIKFKKS